MIQAIKGTKDVYGEEAALWQYLENELREICILYNMWEIRTPIFEATELFVTNVGDTTDVVQKEMYTFLDKGGRSITLKPEVTASSVRACLEHGIYAGTQPTKLYYISPCFRYEKPQAGRMRQFHQFGIEIYGTYSAAADVEVISLGQQIVKRLGIKNVKLYINSLGTNESRKTYNKQLKDFLETNISELCPVCAERVGKNPLRVLDCKEDKCRKILESAPSTIDSLDEEGKKHFETVQKLLRDIDIDFEINDRIVRGLDYYTKTVFEFVSEDIGAQSTIIGGGRYDNMIKESGGPDMGAVGFAMGMERIVLALKNQGIAEEHGLSGTDVFIGYVGEKGFYEAQKLVFDLRDNNIKAETDTLERSVKAQLKYANKIKAKFALVMGDDEIEKGRVKIKNMDTGEQIEVEVGKIKEFLKGEN